MGMSDNSDTNVLMDFRSEHWDLWKEFVKDNEDYCQKCFNNLDWCDCDITMEFSIQELKDIDRAFNVLVDKENDRTYYEAFTKVQTKLKELGYYVD